MKISITGVPGTGKTTVSKLLAGKMGFEYIDLNKLAEEKNLYSGYDDNRKCSIVDVDKLNKKIPDNSVLDAHYSHLLSSDIIIILKLDIKELRQRLNDRGYREEKIQENIDAQIMEVIKSDIQPLSFAKEKDLRSQKKTTAKTKPRRKIINQNFSLEKKISEPSKGTDTERKLDKMIIEIDVTNKSKENIVKKIMDKL